MYLFTLIFLTCSYLKANKISIVVKKIAIQSNDYVFSQVISIEQKKKLPEKMFQKKTLKLKRKFSSLFRILFSKSNTTLYLKEQMRIKFIELLYKAFVFGIIRESITLVLKFIALLIFFYQTDVYLLIAVYKILSLSDLLPTLKA